MRWARDPVAVAILAAAAALRFWDLGRRSLWLDEAWAAVGCLDSPLDVAHVRHTPLLFAAMVRLSAAAFGRSEVAVRLPATLFSLAAVVLVYRLGRDLVSRGAGVFAAAVVGLLPIPVYYGKELKPYSAELFLALAVASLVQHLRQSPRSAAGWVGLVAIALLGAGLGSVALVLIAGALVVLLPVVRRSPVAYAGTVLGFGLAALAWVRLVFAPQVANEPELMSYWRLFFLPHGPPRALAAAALQSGIEATTWGLGNTLPHHNDSMLRLATLAPAAACAVMGAMVVGAVHLVRRGAGWFVGLAVTWHLLVAGAALAGRYPYGPARIALFFLAPTAIVLGAAADGGASLVPSRVRPAGWCLLLVPLLWPLAGTWQENVAQPFEREELRPVLEAVFSQRRPGDRIWVSPGAVSAFRFYVPEPDAQVVLGGPGSDPGSVQASLRAAARGETRVWAIFGHRQAVEEPVAMLSLSRAQPLARIAATGASAVLVTLPLPPPPNAPPALRRPALADPQSRVAAPGIEPGT